MGVGQLDDALIQRFLLTAEFLADGPARRALAERFHEKYPRLERLWGSRTMPADRVMFRIAPERVRSWGLA